MSLWQLGYVYISNGSTRKVDKHKKKKIKHLKFVYGNSAYISSKLKNGEKVTNTDLRRELQKYNDKQSADVSVK